MIDLDKLLEKKRNKSVDKGASNYKTKKSIRMTIHETKKLAIKLPSDQEPEDEQSEEREDFAMKKISTPVMTGTKTKKMYKTKTIN